MDWVLADRQIKTNNLERESLVVEGQGFYEFLAAALEEDPQIIRFFSSLDLIIEGAGQELVDLLRIEGANLGLTSIDNAPVYSNIDGGLGIFSSKNKAVRRNLFLNTSSMDSLRFGIFTRDLNFQ